MGWLIYDIAPASIPAEIDALCTFANADRKARPLNKVQVGSTWYVAVEVQLTQPGGETWGYEADETGRYVFGLVILTTRQGGGWGYKDIEEAMGPVETRAPASLIALLSPTDRRYAMEWRKACLDHAGRCGIGGGKSCDASVMGGKESCFSG